MPRAPMAAWTPSIPSTVSAAHPRRGAAAAPAWANQGFRFDDAVTGHEFTRQTIRALLDGGDPAACAAVPLAAYGPWAEIVRLLIEAHAEGGAAAVTAVYTSLLRANESFTMLMCANDRVQRRWKMRYLLRCQRKPTEFIIPGFVPVGVTNLAGRPKRVGQPDAQGTGRADGAEQGEFVHPPPEPPRPRRAQRRAGAARAGVPGGGAWRGGRSHRGRAGGAPGVQTPG